MTKSAPGSPVDYLDKKTLGDSFAPFIELTDGGDFVGARYPC